MKSASNGGILNSSLQVLHIHVLLVAPLGTGHMSQPGADKHEGRIAVRETAHHTSAAADLPVQPFNDVIGTDASPVFAGKIAVSQPASFSFMERSCSTTALAFSRAALLLSWAWIALSIFATSFTLERGVTENTLR